jgi:uncharacterized protein (DUF1810 family)
MASMNPDPSDPFDLERFVRAQDPVIDTVLAELRAGAKETHWMWFVFPQLGVLGRSDMARRYGISGLAEARAYLAHPVLGPRLKTCCELLLQHGDRTARQIFGATDEVKLRSCLTLFHDADPAEPAFGACLARFFGGQADALTQSLVG